MYKFLIYSFLVFVYINTAFGDISQKNKFEGKIVFDRAYGGFHIFKIDGSLPEKEIQLTKKNIKHYENYVEPKWSPDGKYIAYIARPEIEKSNIFIMDSNGENIKQITNLSYGIIINMRWNRNGNEILFTYNHKGEMLEKAVDIGTSAIKNIEGKEEKLEKCNYTIPSPNEETLICEKWLMPDKWKISIYQKEDSDRSWSKYITVKIKKILHWLNDEQEIVLFKDNFYNKKREFFFEGLSFSPLWSQDSLRFANLNREYLTIFDKDGSEIARIKELCKGEGATCLRSWPANINKMLYSCYCGAEEIQEKIYLIDLKTKKYLYITEGQNPDWYHGIK
jgi:Tol biopolymer transport system component